MFGIDRVESLKVVMVFQNIGGMGIALIKMVQIMDISFIFVFKP